MENLISNTYFVVGLKKGDSAKSLQKTLTDIEGVISVKIDSAKSHVQITSKETFDMETLQKATVNTDYYITEIKPNNILATPYSSAVDSVKQKHNASGDVDGGDDGFLNSGPTTDYTSD
jgi:copper chaperone CopZ